MVGAFVTILTRSFVTDVYEERLVPLLDMLQHSDTSSVTHSGDEAGGWSSGEGSLRHCRGR